MAKAKLKTAKQPVTADEKARLRALKLVGHDHLITKDEHGRDRLAQTALHDRQFDIGGYKTVVRVRNVDPLAGIMSLSWQQRQAGKRYREDYEICEREGVKPASWEMRVDGSSAGKTMPERIAEAHASRAKANQALGYGEMVKIIERVCGEGMSIAELSRIGLRLATEGGADPAMVAANATMRRESISLLLGMALQKLAVHYGFVTQTKR